MIQETWRAPMGWLAGLVCTAVAMGDVVTLKDGSRLVGTVKRMANGKLTLATEFAGDLEIDAAGVESFDTDETINVQMQSGDRLVGPVSTDAPERATVKTATGDVSVDVSQVEAIWPEGADSPEQIAAQEELNRKAGEWSFTGEIGATKQDGNTDSANALGRLNLERKLDDNLISFYFQGRYGENNDIRNEAEVIGGIYFEKNVTPDFFWFVRNEAEYDEFESIDLRYTLTAGPGYYLIHEDNHELKAHAGIGYLHETFSDPPGDSDDSMQAEVGINDPPGGYADSMQAEVGVSYFVDLVDWLRFGHYTLWFPTFEGLDDYRLRSDTYVQMPLGTSDKWNFKIGALYQYNSMPNPGRESLDETYYANILLELKQK